MEISLVLWNLVLQDPEGHVTGKLNDFESLTTEA